MTSDSEGARENSIKTLEYIGRGRASDRTLLSWEIVLELANENVKTQKMHSIKENSAKERRGLSKTSTMVLLIYEI